MPNVTPVSNDAVQRGIGSSRTDAQRHHRRTATSTCRSPTTRIIRPALPTPCARHAALDAAGYGVDPTIVMATLQGPADAELVGNMRKKSAARELLEPRTLAGSPGRLLLKRRRVPSEFKT